MPVVCVQLPNRTAELSVTCRESSIRVTATTLTANKKILEAALRRTTFGAAACDWVPQLPWIALYLFRA